MDIFTLKVVLRCRTTLALLREVINRVLKTLSSLEKVLVNRCQWFSKNWDIVQPHVGFQWICEIEKQYESS